MFYSVFVLGKKGPLARVWLAAHWDKKITKSQILETNIVESVDSILQPRIKLSLRTSSHLLLGIVRIYARKTVYLLQDCQDAAFKIKSAFRPGAVDLPEGKQEAALNAITLPEVLDFVTNFDLIEPPALIEPVVNTTNHRNITLSEDVAITDDTFDYSTWGNQSKASMVRDRSTMSGAEALAKQFDNNVTDDGFGGQLGPDDEFFQVDIDANGAPKLGDTDDQDLLDDRPASRASIGSDMSGAASMADSGPPSTPGGNAFENADIDNVQGPFDSMRDIDMGPPGDAETSPNHTSRMNGNTLPTIPEEDRSGLPAENNELPDSMVLDPVVQDAQGAMPKRKRRKKLGIIIDDVKTLSGEEIKAQLSDTKDIVTVLDLAPPSKQLMEVKRSTNVDKLFTIPECHILSKILIDHYSRNLVSSKLDYQAAEGELESFARDPTSHSTSFIAAAASFDNFDTYVSGPPADVSFPMEQPSDFGGELLPPRTPKTPASYRETGHQRTSPKKKRARTDVANDTPITDRNRSSTQNKSRSSQRSMSPLPFDHQESEMDDERSQYNNNNNNHSNQRYSQDQDDDDTPVDDAIAGETEEQYEERIRNRRTHILLKLMSQKLDQGTLEFSSLCRNYRRKQVAQNFFSLLVLKKQQAIDLCQADTGDSYGEITISKGPRYASFVSSD